MFPLCLLSASCTASAPQRSLADLYTKMEIRIPMRDGVKLYTAVYIPKDTSEKHPMLIERTPYSAGPYGANRLPFGLAGQKYIDARYIIVEQDVRGRYMSEGKWVEIRPLTSKWKDPKDIDEATDSWDTVDYLVKNIPNNNGNVGFTGVSYPGFYAACAGVHSHPAVKAISPQAPVTDWFMGDDVHHNGAFFLQDNFDFYFFFGYDHAAPAPDHPQVPPMGPRPDAYKFFLEAGNSQHLGEKYYQGKIGFWQEICDHPAYDAFWQARSTQNFLTGVKCAVLTVGGLFDAEDMYGAYATFHGVEKHNPGTLNSLVIGPWSHGGWEGSGQGLGPMKFGSATGTYFRDEIEFPFFDHYLRGKTAVDMPKARVFNTGVNTWKSFAAWPPKEAKPYTLYFQADHGLSSAAPTSAQGSDSYVSDPANPVPYQPGTIRNRSTTYMVANQSFLDGRTDILRYTSAPLTEDLTLTGPVTADVKMSTTGTDGDLIAKIVDVSPEGDEQLIRWEVMRCQFLDSFSKPRALRPGKVERVTWKLPDMLHTFLKGHRVAIHVQSSMFPLIDMNPQTFTNIYKAKPSDYKAAKVTIWRSKTNASSITFGRL